MLSGINGRVNGEGKEEVKGKNIRKRKLSKIKAKIKSGAWILKYGKQNNYC